MQLIFSSVAQYSLTAAAAATLHGCRRRQDVDGARLDNFVRHDVVEEHGNESGNGEASLENEDNGVFESPQTLVVGIWKDVGEPVRNKSSTVPEDVQVRVKVKSQAWNYGTYPSAKEAVKTKRFRRLKGILATMARPLTRTDA